MTPADPRAPGAIRVRALEGRDRPQVVELLDAQVASDDFTRDEVVVAIELVDAALAGTDDPDGYRVIVCERLDFEPSRVDGYLCYGPTPMTVGTFDLYWIATHPRARRSGVGAALLRALDQAIESRGGRLIRVETSGRDAYAGTRAFYDRNGFREVARIEHFYADDDALVIFGRYIGG